METIGTILTSTFLASIIAMVIQKTISERIEQSIRNKYLLEIESFKNEFNIKILSIQNENQISQLHTSLFFDHQRNAFGCILSKISETNNAWLESEYDEEEGLKGPVPYNSYKELEKLFIENQLFFDSSCLMAIDLILDIYNSSFSVHDSSGNIFPQNVGYAYRTIEFLQPKLTAIFQNRIGIIASNKEEYQLALFGAIRILNHYHFPEISLPPIGNLRIKSYQEPLEAIQTARIHIIELKNKVEELYNYLRCEECSFDKALNRVEKYLLILSRGDK